MDTSKIQLCNRAEASFLIFQGARCQLDLRKDVLQYYGTGHTKVRRVAHGNFAQVLRAEKSADAVKDAPAELQELPQFLAIRIPRKTNDLLRWDQPSEDKRRVMSQLATEVVMHRRLKDNPHEHITKLLSIVDTKHGHLRMSPSPMLCYEYGEHGSLKTFLQRQFRVNAPAPIELKIQLGRDSGLGLLSLHNLDITHGDFKLDNILVFDHPDPQRKYIAKVADFGSISIRDHPGKTGDTHEWLSPEEINMDDDDGTSLEEAKLWDAYAYGLSLWTIYIDGASPGNDTRVKQVMKSCDVINFEDLKLQEDEIILAAIHACFMPGSEEHEQVRRLLSSVSHLVKSVPAMRDIVAALKSLDSNVVVETRTPGQLGLRTLAEMLSLEHSRDIGAAEPSRGLPLHHCDGVLTELDRVQRQTYMEIHESLIVLRGMEIDFTTFDALHHLAQAGLSQSRKLCFDEAVVLRHLISTLIVSVMRRPQSFGTSILMSCIRALRAGAILEQERDMTPQLQAFALRLSNESPQVLSSGPETTIWLQQSLNYHPEAEFLKVGITNAEQEAIHQTLADNLSTRDRWLSWRFNENSPFILHDARELLDILKKSPFDEVRIRSWFSTHSTTSRPDDIHLTIFGDNALHYAASVSDLGLMQFLVQEGFNLNSVNLLQQTALLLSLTRGSTDTARFLLAHNAGDLFDAHQIVLSQHPVQYILSFPREEQREMLDAICGNRLDTFRSLWKAPSSSGLFAYYFPPGSFSVLGYAILAKNEVLITSILEKGKEILSSNDLLELSNEVFLCAIRAHCLDFVRLLSHLHLEYSQMDLSFLLSQALSTPYHIRVLCNGQLRGLMLEETLRFLAVTFRFSSEVRAGEIYDLAVRNNHIDILPYLAVISQHSRTPPNVAQGLAPMPSAMLAICRSGNLEAFEQFCSSITWSLEELLGMKQVSGMIASQIQAGSSPPEVRARMLAKLYEMGWRPCALALWTCIIEVQVILNRSLRKHSSNHGTDDVVEGIAQLSLSQDMGKAACIAEIGFARAQLSPPDMVEVLVAYLTQGTTRFDELQLFLQLLTDAGVDIARLQGEGFLEGQTPFHFVAAQDTALHFDQRWIMDVTELLGKSEYFGKAEILNRRNSANATALDLAVLFSNTAFVEALVKVVGSDSFDLQLDRCTLDSAWEHLERTELHSKLYQYHFQHRIYLETETVLQEDQSWDITTRTAAEYWELCSYLTDLEKGFNRHEHLEKLQSLVLAIANINLAVVLPLATMGWRSYEIAQVEPSMLALLEHLPLVQEVLDVIHWTLAVWPTAVALRRLVELFEVARDPDAAGDLHGKKLALKYGIFGTLAILRLMDFEAVDSFILEKPYKLLPEAAEMLLRLASVFSHEYADFNGEKRRKLNNHRKGPDYVTQFLSSFAKNASEYYVAPVIGRPWILQAQIATLASLGTKYGWYNDALFVGDEYIETDVETDLDHGEISDDLLSLKQCIYSRPEAGSLWHLSDSKTDDENEAVMESPGRQIILMITAVVGVRWLEYLKMKTDPRVQLKSSHFLKATEEMNLARNRAKIMTAIGRVNTLSHEAMKRASKQFHLFRSLVMLTNQHASLDFYLNMQLQPPSHRMRVWTSALQIQEGDWAAASGSMQLMLTMEHQEYFTYMPPDSWLEVCKIHDLWTGEGPLPESGSSNIGESTIAALADFERYNRICEYHFRALYVFCSTQYGPKRPWIFKDGGIVALSNMSVPSMTLKLAECFLSNKSGFVELIETSLVGKEWGDETWVRTRNPRPQTSELWDCSYQRLRFFRGGDSSELTTDSDCLGP